MSTLVVVGDSDLLQRTRELLPNFQVLGVTDDPGLGDPASGVVSVRNLIESGRAPEAVLLTAAPGFTVLSQLPHFPPSRCFVHPRGGIWPQATLEWIVEASGMTVVEDLETLPAALLGRGGRPESPGADEQQPPPPGRTSVVAAPPASSDGPSAGYEWADETPVQVPPPPVSLDFLPPEPVVRVIDAGDSSSVSQTAYLPTDLLRPLRPRRG